MTDIISNSSAQRLVVDTLTCNTNRDSQCLEYTVGYHIREGEVARNTTDANLLYRLQSGSSSRYIPIFPSGGPSSRNLQVLYSPGLTASTELSVAAVSLSTIRSALRSVINLNQAQAASFDNFLHFMYLGNFETPDSIQSSQNQALFDSIFSLSAADFEQVHLHAIPFLHYNGMNLGALMTQEVKVRMNIVRDWFALRRAVENNLEHLHINPSQKARAVVVFHHMLRNVYFGNPSLEMVNNELNQLSNEIAANPGQGGRNIYAALSQIFLAPLPYQNPDSSNMTTLNGGAFTDYLNLLRSESITPYSSRYPFNLSRSNFQPRLQAVQRTLETSPLRAYFEYSSLQNPQQLMIDYKVSEYQQANNAIMILRNVTSHSQIQVGRMNTEWLTANSGARIREIVTELLFTGQEANPQAPALLQARPVELPRMLIRVDHLRERVAQLLLHHPAEAVEYRAAALGIMIQLFGNGVARDRFAFQVQRSALQVAVPTSTRSPDAQYRIEQTPFEFRLFLDVESRTELNSFYRDLASSLGYSDAANTAQTSVQWVSLGLCLAGTGARVIYNSTQNNWDGHGDGLLAASGVFCGYSLGAFGADLFGGARRNNRVTRNNIAGGVGAALLGTGFGLLPMAVPAPRTTPPNMMMVNPMTRPINGRNPTTGFGP